MRGARALADVKQLEIALEAFAARQQQTAGARNGPELERLSAMLEEREAAIRESERRERDAVTQRDAFQARLNDALAMCEEREASLRQLEAAHADLAASHAAAAAEHDRLMSALREQASRLDALANGAPFGGGASAAAEAAAADAGCEEART
jgi:DNA repair exonuclease SbcCD ATPase subunit